MARRSRLAGRFDRECGWAARSLCRAFLCACRQIQLAPKIRWQTSMPPKKSSVIHLIFSCFLLLLLRANVPGFSFALKTEPRLTLCDSASGILRRSFGERQAESFVRKPPNLLTFTRER